MTNREIQETIKTVLGLKKDMVGIKAWKELPRRVKKYEGKAFPGFCSQIGEVLKTGETFCTDEENQLCTGGVIATGVTPPVSAEESPRILQMHIEMMNDYPDIERAERYRENMEKLIPVPQEKNAFVQLGLFIDLQEPDLAILFCSPGSADIITRTYAYVTGEPVIGFAGNGGCQFAIQYPYATKKPSFTYSDITWRKFVGLSDDELTITFPYPCLTRFIESLPAVAERYRSYGKGME